MEATHGNNRRSMDPLQKKVILWGSIAGAIVMLWNFTMNTAVTIVKAKDAIEAVPLLHAKDEELERRLSENERVNKETLRWLQAFGDKWDVKPPRPWAERRRPNE